MARMGTNQKEKAAHALRDQHQPRIFLFVFIRALRGQLLVANAGSARPAPSASSYCKRPADEIGEVILPVIVRLQLNVFPISQISRSGSICRQLAWQSAQLQSHINPLAVPQYAKP